MLAERRRLVVAALILTGTLASAIPATAQARAPADVAGPSEVVPQVPAAWTTVTPENPFGRRPVCASMFLKAEWRLSFKQRSCDWIQNRMFSMSAFGGAAWSAGSSMVLDRPSEEGDGFARRFAHKFAQNAFKSTGAYAGGLVFKEDPRSRPPFLVLQGQHHAHGFFRRAGHAIAGNVMAYRCAADCTRPEHIKRVFALSRLTGSIASGAASGLWEASRQGSGSRLWRGAASAYGSTFVNALFVEFKPEISALGNKALRGVFGGP